jgi:hypothetical protein
MKYTLTKRSKRTCITLAAFAFVTFGTGTALADPTPKPITFAKASLDIETQGEAAGSLNCSWRETGLAPLALVAYECTAAAGAVVEGCFYKNKFVPDAGTEMTVAFDMTNVEGGHETELYLASNGGAISGEILLAPEAPHTPGSGHLCPEPLEQAVIAARYCDMELRDTTNGIVGTTEVELFAVLAKGVAPPVPTCEEMLSTP